MNESSARFGLSSLIAVVLCIALLAGAYLAGRWLLADLSEMRASEHQENWSELGSVSTKQDWQDAYNSLQRAIELKPNDAFLYQQLGVMHELKVFAAEDLQLTELEIMQSRLSAAAAYKQSAILRPAWPDGWAHLARTKAYLVQLDDEFFQAFNNAVRLGSTEPRVDQELRPLCPLLAFFEVSEALSNFCSEEG